MISEFNGINGLLIITTFNLACPLACLAHSFFVLGVNSKFYQSTLDISPVGQSSLHRFWSSAHSPLQEYP